MAHRRNLHDGDTEPKHLCDTDSYEYVEDTEWDEDEDYYEEEQPSLPYNKNRLRSGARGLRLTKHVSISLLVVVTEERSRIKHST